MGHALSGVLRKLVLLLFVCAACQGATQMQSARQALLRDNYDEALARFQALSEKDPEYFYRSGPFRENIWTYVGRTQYTTGRLTEARPSLERALSLDKDDYLAHIYLGLTLTRLGDRANGLKEIEAGLRGLHDWLEYLTYNTRFAVYWDPNREIRIQIEKDLDAITNKNVTWPQLIADAEWIGKKTEEEVDTARQDEWRQRQFRDDRFHGPGIGVGIGF
jgi:tetratricopeptide (TPR) repeat protein